MSNDREKATAKRAAMTNARSVERPAQGPQSGFPTVGYGSNPEQAAAKRRKKR